MAYQIIENNIVMPKGDTAIIPLNFDFDLTDCVITLSVKTLLTDTSFIFQATNSTHIDAVNGLSSITITPADTKSLKAGNYFVDFVIVLANDERHTFFPKISNTYDGEVEYLILQEHVNEG